MGECVFLLELCNGIMKMDDFRKAVSLGIAKINIGTASFKNVTGFAANYLASEGKHDYFGLNTAMTQGMYENALRHIKVFTGIE